ncbi:MAG: threonine--tRNA ligase, partial [Oligoflexia bacterium]|nr:threonine--tRNA ligase [Oligoflexia bacterium]
INFATQLCKNLRQNGFRVRLDSRNESMNLKTRQIQTSKIPYMIVVGDREVDNESASIRKYGDKKSEVVSVNDLHNLFTDLMKEANI